MKIISFFDLNKKMPMQKKLLPIFYFLLFFYLLANAQQLPLFTQYREMHAAINPAIMADQVLNGGYQAYVGASVRNQWVGREGAPRTQMVHGEWLTDGRRGFGALIGGHIINDQAGQLGYTGVYGRIASTWYANPRNPEEAGFSAGLAIGIVQFRVSLNDVIARDKDPIQEAGDVNKIHKDVSLGVYGWQELGNETTTLYGGTSIPQVLGIKLQYRDSFGLERVRHYFGLMGVKQELGGSGSILELSSWVKYVPHAPVHVDLNLRLFQTLADETVQLWIGAGMDTAKAVHAEIGFIPGYEGKIQIGYSFDFNTSNKILKFGNSHEVNVALMIGGD